MSIQTFGLNAQICKIIKRISQVYQRCAKRDMAGEKCFTHNSCQKNIPVVSDAFSDNSVISPSNQIYRHISVSGILYRQTQ